MKKKKQAYCYMPITKSGCLYIRYAWSSAKAVREGLNMGYVGEWKLTGMKIVKVKLTIVKKKS